MSNSITITVPAHDKQAVRAAAAFFAELAGQERGCGCHAAPVDATRGQDVLPGIMHSTTESILADKCIPGFDGIPYDDPTTPVDAGSAFGLPPAPPAPPAPPTLGAAVAELTALAVPPVPPVVPASPAPPTPRAGAKLDSEGLPWDRRINASTKTLRQSDGTWKLIRGVSEALVTSVKAELQLAMGQTAAPVGPNGGVMVPIEQFNAGTIPQPVVNQIITLPTPPAPPLPDLDNDGSWPSPPVPAPPAPPAPPVLTLVPTPPAPPAPPADDPFPKFVQFCTSNQQSGRLKYEAIVATCGKYGITQLPMLNARHDLIPAIRAELEALCSP